MDKVNTQFIITLIIIAIGYIFKQVGIIKKKDGESIAKIILNITLPALFIKTFSAIEIKAELLLLPSVSLLYSVFLLFIALLVFRKLKLEQKGLHLLPTLGFNTALFAYPLIEGIWGQEGLSYIAMFDIGNTFVIFVIIYIVACVYSPLHSNISAKLIFKKLVSSLPLWAYVIGIILNVIGFEIPTMAGTILDILSKANGALVYLLLGIYLNLKFDKSILKVLLKVFSLRYIAGLSLGLILFFLMPFAPLFKGILLISLVLPIGMTIIPYSIEYGYDSKTIGMLVNISNVVSFILIWILSLSLKL